MRKFRCRLKRGDSYDDVTFNANMMAYRQQTIEFIVSEKEIAPPDPLYYKPGTVVGVVSLRNLMYIEIK